MNNEEIMLNEFIEDTTDEIATSSGKGFKVAGIVALAVLGGVGAYRYVIKPIVVKIKAKKEQQRIDAEEFDGNFVEIEEE